MPIKSHCWPIATSLAALAALVAAAAATLAAADAASLALDFIVRFPGIVRMERRRRLIPVP